MLDAFVLWLVAAAVGIAAVPVAAALFPRLPGGGLALARPLGLLLLAYPAWLLAALGLAPYGGATIAIGAAVLLAAGALLARRGIEALRVPAARRLWLAGEATFTAAFAAWALVRAFSPDVWGTEKPMDMAFVNAVNRSESFPPHDPWFAGADLNYYYFGHYLVALLVRATSVDPEVGFNLAMALVPALVAGAVFAVAGTLSLARGRDRRAVVDGLVAVAVAAVLGNLAGATGLLSNTADPDRYDWWAPSRVIEGTANEFAYFSFLLGDLHAHVMVTPFALLFLGFVLQVALAGPGSARRPLGALGELVLGGLVLGSLYALNTLDFVTAVALLAGGLVVWLVSDLARDRLRALLWTSAVPLVGLVLFAPFVLRFDPVSDGVALVREHLPFTEFAADLGLIYGLPLLVVAAAVAHRLAVPRRYLAWAGTGLLVVLVLVAPWRLAALLVLLAVAAIAAHAALDPRLTQPERFFWLLVAAGLALVAVGDFAYVRDAFDGTASYRFNTVFKAGYQAWFLLSIVAAAGLTWAVRWTSRNARRAWLATLAALVALAAVYPAFATYSRTGGFARSPTLDGLAWLRERAPGDAAALSWLQGNVPGSPVVLETVGADFSPDGHGRVSTFTGMPTVVGWVGHVLQWGHEPGTRAADVETIYATRNPAQARRLLERYDVRYVFVGSLERRRYSRAALAKFSRLGEPVFREAGTTIWAVRG